MEDYFCKKPCKHCPYRVDVNPFLTPSRGEELAYHAENPYNSFPCHKTTIHDEDSEDGEMKCTNQTKECAGFLTMMVAINGNKFKPKGFEPSFDIVYSDTWDMICAYDPENN